MRKARPSSASTETQQRILLDRFGNIAIRTCRRGPRSLATSTEQSSTTLLQGEQDRLRMVDLWSYQRKEIEAAHLEAGRR